MRGIIEENVDGRVTIDTGPVASPARELHDPPADALAMPDPASERVRREIQAAADHAAGLASLSRAENTRISYEERWRRFALWCDRHGAIDPTRASPAIVAVYLAAMDQEGFAANSIAAHATALGVRLQAHDPIAWPKRTWPPAVEAIVAGIFRTRGRAPIYAKQAFEIEQIARVIDPRRSLLLHELLERTIILVGFWCAMRRSEIAALNVADLELDGGKGIHVTVRRSKTDQEGETRRITAPHQSARHLCAHCHLPVWLAAAHISSGAVFRAVHRGVLRNRINSATICRIVQRYAAQAGLDPKDIGAHSLRAGFVTSAAKRGMGLDAIMRQTGHKNVEMVRRYIRYATPYQDNAAADMGDELNISAKHPSHGNDWEKK